MLELIQRLERDPDVRVDEYLPLTYEFRQKRWLRARLGSGEEISLRLARGEQLRAGDLFVGKDGRVVEVVALPEPVVQAWFATLGELVRAAYHLGNRHAPVQISTGYLRIKSNHVLEAMLKNLGATLVSGRMPFEPERGAYAGLHSHGDDEARARIHEYRNEESTGPKR